MGRQGTTLAGAHSMVMTKIMMAAVAVLALGVGLALPLPPHPVSSRLFHAATHP